MALTIAGARDPAAADGLAAWQTHEGVAVATEDAEPALLSVYPGRAPALGGGMLAWLEGQEAVLVSAPALEPLARLPVEGADSLAVSASWLAFRRVAGGAEQIVARELATGAERVLAEAKAPARLGRPALEGDVLVFHVAGVRVSRIDEVDLTTGARRALRSSRTVQLTNPTLAGDVLAYVRVTNAAQQLLAGPRRPVRDRVLRRANGVSRRDRGHEHGKKPHKATPPPAPPAPHVYWTTALSERFAYLTLSPLTRGQAPRLLRIPR